MLSALDVDVDRILAQWVRLNQRLATNSDFGLKAHDIIRGVEMRLVAGKRLREALLADPRLSNSRTLNGA